MHLNIRLVLIVNIKVNVRQQTQNFGYLSSPLPFLFIVPAFEFVVTFRSLYIYCYVPAFPSLKVLSAEPPLKKVDTFKTYLGGKPPERLAMYPWFPWLIMICFSKLWITTKCISPRAPLKSYILFSTAVMFIYCTAGSMYTKPL